MFFLAPFCSSDTPYLCGDSCLLQDDLCDGEAHCDDGVDEYSCGKLEYRSMLLFCSISSGVQMFIFVGLISKSCPFVDNAK